MNDRVDQWIARHPWQYGAGLGACVFLGILLLMLVLGMSTPGLFATLGMLGSSAYGVRQANSIRATLPAPPDPR